MEIKVQIRAIDKNNCKRVFENMIKRLDARQEIGAEDILNITYNKNNFLGK